MKANSTSIIDVLVIETDCHCDKRGWFMETYNKENYVKLGIYNDFVQDNMSLSENKGTLRGLHYQKGPYTQAKLVRCIHGEVIDLCVDLRKGSPNYLQYESALLTAENKKQFYIPRGFAHGYITLTDNVIFEYKVDNPYNKDCDRSIRYDDPDINVNWGQLLQDIKPILSEKDMKAPFLKDSDCDFVYRGEM